MGPTLILEMARVYGLRPRLWLLSLFISYILDNCSCQEHIDMLLTIFKNFHFFKLKYCLKSFSQDCRVSRYFTEANSRKESK